MIALKDLPKIKAELELKSKGLAEYTEEGSKEEAEARATRLKVLKKRRRLGLDPDPRPNPEGLQNREETRDGGTISSRRLLFRYEASS